MNDQPLVGTRASLFQTTNQYNVIICLIPKLCIFFGRPPIYVRMAQIWKAKTARFAIKCVVSHLETNIYGELWCVLLSYFFFKASTAVFTALAQDSTDLNLFCCLVGYVWPPQDEGSNQLRHL